MCRLAKHVVDVKVTNLSISLNIVFCWTSGDSVGPEPGRGLPQRLLRKAPWLYLCALYAARLMEQSLGLSLLVAGMQNDLITSAKQWPSCAAWDAGLRCRKPRNSGNVFFNTSIPTPREGEGRGDKTNLSNSTFFAWKPWDSDQTPQMEWWRILIIEKAWLQKWNFKMEF